MLEFYCLLRYKASTDLRNAILNNMLVNLSGHLGAWIEGDLMQEHYNRWLEDMVTKRGGNFDDKFYRHTISPNINHFLRIKEIVKAAFDLQSRSKTHTSLHLRAESTLLLTMYKETELHHFRSKRSMGHAAKNHFDIGYSRLQSGKLAEFVWKTTAYADVVAGVQAAKKKDASGAGQAGMGLPTVEVLLERFEMMQNEKGSPSDSGDSDSNSTSSNESEPDGTQASHAHSRTSTDTSSSTSDSDIDVSDKQLSSGSYRSMYIDPVT